MIKLEKPVNQKFMAFPDAFFIVQEGIRCFKVDKFKNQSNCFIKGEFLNAANQ